MRLDHLAEGDQVSTVQAGVAVIGWVVVVLAALTLCGRMWERVLRERSLRRHRCPTTCRESVRCKCGCNGLLALGNWPQQRCGLCGTPIVRDDEGEYDGPFSMGPGCMNEAGSPDDGMDRDDDRDWGPYQ